MPAADDADPYSQLDTARVLFDQLQADAE